VVCTTFGGTTGDIAWIGRYDNSAQIEDVYLKIAGDRYYQAALTKARQLFVPGGAHDQMSLHAQVHRTLGLLGGFAISANADLAWHRGGGKALGAQRARRHAHPP
jgi:hypothetical protein